MIERYARWVIHWRYAVIFITLFLIGLAASGGRFLTFSTDYRVFFSPENPQLNAFEALQQVYTKNDNVLFVLAPEDGNVFTPETLEAVTWLTQAAWQIPYSIRVDSLSNFQHTHAQGDDLIVSDLVTNAQRLSPTDIRHIKTIALQEPLLRNRLISPQGHVTGVNVIIQLPDENQATTVMPEVTAFSRQIVEQLRTRYPHLAVHLTGIVIMNHAFPEATQQDMKSLVPLMYFVVLVSLGFLLKGFSVTFATLLVISFAIVTAMGLTGWLGVTLSPPSAPAPIIILTLGVANSVHLIVTLLYEMRRHGRSQHAALIESLRVNFQPIFLTSFTTVIGFLSFNFSDVPPFRHLGNIVAVGVSAAFILSVTFLPALLVSLPLRPKPIVPEAVPLMARFAEQVVQRHRSLLWGMTGIILFLVAFVPRNALNDIFVNYFDNTFDFRRATDFATANLTGLYTIEYSLSAGKSGGVSDPVFLQTVDRFAQWYRQQPEAIHVNTITDTFKRLNKNMHGDDLAYYRLPAERALAAQYLLLYEMSLPYGLDLNNQINIDKSATRLSVSLKTLSTNELLALEQRAQHWLQDNALPTMQQPGASPALIFAHIGYRNIRGMLIGAAIALVLISFTLIIALRSLKYGLISLIPNLIPAGMAFGLWGLLVGEVGLSLSVVAGMTLGIVVDDTIYFLSKYLYARRDKGATAVDAVRYAFHCVGMALWITTVVLVLGFLVLALSHFRINADLGLLAAVTLMIGLAADFLFLPPLLIQLEKEAT